MIAIRMINGVTRIVSGDRVMHECRHSCITAAAFAIAGFGLLLIGCDDKRNLVPISPNAPAATKPS